MHLLIGTHDGVNWASLYAKGATDAGGFFNKGDGACFLYAIGWIQWDACFA